MKICEWQIGDSVSIASLDTQHQKLFDIFNELFTLMDKNAEDQEIIKALAGLVEYAQYHFREEEAVMEKMHYPDLLAHQQEHQDFVKVVKDFHSEAQNARALFVALRAANTGASWLKNHIHAVDFKYTEYMKKQGLQL
jgi:hemerythrin